MNTNHLKGFAQEARNKMITQVGARLSYVLTVDSAELREKTTAVKQLREELERTSKEQLVEKVAYTWFNRLMALRFMDANDYQPLGIRVITPKDGYTIPEILDEAKRGNVPGELKVNRQKIYDILDGKTPSSNPQNEAYKELLIASCNHLHTTFPFLFERINDYTELLLPDDLISDFSIVKDVRDGMPIEDCTNVEIIGWLYQFYISEKKDEVFASKSKVKKEDIPAATQLFTPRWIVEYMVQNTLGKLWLQNRPKSRLREHMPYFIESASLESEDYLKIQSPEEIKFLDPASGSGHILVYAFDLFTKIYEEEGYNNSEIPQLIIQNNIYGFEIDERAAQLSALALMMKAREYHRRVFRKEIKPNVLCFQDLLVTEDEIKEIFASQKIQISNELMHDLLLMQQATNFGSLIIPHPDTSEIKSVLDKFSQYLPNAGVFQRSKVEELIGSLKQLLLLGLKFHCVVANPPYMGVGKFNNELSNLIKNNFNESKADLSACFISSAIVRTNLKGLIGFVTLDSWMFLSSFSSFRKIVISRTNLFSMIHIGWNCFPQGHVYNRGVAFVLSTSKESISLGKFLNLSNVPATVNKQKLFNERKSDNRNIYLKSLKDFLIIPETPIAYWLNTELLNNLSTSQQLSHYGKAHKGLDTCDNDRYVRFWSEIENLTFSETHCAEKKWFVYQKGGPYRKWYGNNEKVVNWGSDGYEIRNFRNADGTIKSRPQNVRRYFSNGITWSAVGSGKVSYRLLNNSIFGGGGNAFFTSNEMLLPVIGLLNSNTSEFFLDLFSPTINNLSGDIEKIPVFPNAFKSSLCSTLVETNVDISKNDSGQKESNWNFLRNELIRLFDDDAFDFEVTCLHYMQYWKINFIKLHSNEEKLNTFFIDTYKLNYNLTFLVNLEDVSILQDELDRKALAKLNKELKRDPETHLVTNYDEIELPFIASEIMAQFISYAVGCMFGRYSIDKEGLILANQGETINDYEKKILKGRVSTEPIEGGDAVNVIFPKIRFYPDDDNIIPILDDYWFADGIVGRFHEFLKITFGEKHFSKNLAFIEEQIGKDIRKYFLRDFYADHIKRYKKRPIYWLFSSPRGSFNALIYMHRYTPDTVSNILNKYLKEFIGKLKTRREHLQHVQVTGSPTDKTKAIKEIDSIDKTLVELQEYERDILYPLATERIAIDLDDGVLVNYNKFGKAVKEVTGLNDKKTKDKVRKFDWIDVTQIR